MTGQPYACEPDATVQLGTAEPESRQPGIEPDGAQPGAATGATDAGPPDGEPGAEEPAAGEPEAGEPGGGERPRVVPVPLPDGLADVSAGVWLCEAIEGVDPELISGFDTVELLGAAYRQANRQRAIFLRTLLETGLRAPDSADEVVRVSTPGEFAAEEARAALVFSRRRAETALGLAADVFTRLPALGEAMLGGWLDEPRARAFVEWTRGLSDEQAGTVCDGLLPEAPGLMVGELITRIQRDVYAIDPDWAQRRYEDTLATRRIVASRNDDGTANVEGRNLPVDRAAAACDRIDTLARAVKHAGAGKRRIDHIRVDLFLGSTDGTFESMSDEQIIAHVVNHPLVTDPQSDDAEPGTGDTTSTSDGGNADSDADGSDDAEGEGGDTGFTSDESADESDRTDNDNGDEAAPGNDDGGDPDDGEPDDGIQEPDDGDEPGPGGPGGPRGDGLGACDHDDFAGPSGGGPDPAAGHEPADTSGYTDDTGETGDSVGAIGAIGAGDGAGSAGTQARPAPCGWAVRELRVELATLFGWDEHPGEIPATGYVPAMLARQLAAGMASGQWRYVICSPLGRLITCGILAARPRPDGATPRRDARRGGIVEIGVTTGQLDQLATTVDAHGKWAGVITELADHYNTHLADADPKFRQSTSAPTGGRGASAPNASESTSAPDGGHGTRATGTRQGTSVPDGGHGTRATGTRQGTSVPGTGQGTGSADARRRLPGARLRREIQMRDRQCVHIACRMPATRTDLDHAEDYAQGGLTTAANMSAVCRWHHRLKHDGRWAVSKPEPAITLWRTPLGHAYVSVPPLAMPRLPNPRPRNTDGYNLLPTKTSRGCGCYGYCTCGPTMPADARPDEIATEQQTKTRTEDETAPDSDDTPLNIDDDKPPY